MKPQRINPPRWIRHIRIQIQRTRIIDRVFANKPSDPWIIVPIPIVVQPCFVIVVLVHKTRSDYAILHATPISLARMQLLPASGF